MQTLIGLLAATNARRAFTEVQRGRLLGHCLGLRLAMSVMARGVWTPRAFTIGIPLAHNGVDLKDWSIHITARAA